MSVPYPYAYSPPVTPHGRAGPRGNGARIHAIVALSVIASVGSIGAFFALFGAIAAADSCQAPGDLGCNQGVVALVGLGSIPAVLAALALATVGLVRAGRGGGHLPTAAAWVVWGGSCVAWWTLIGLL